MALVSVTDLVKEYPLGSARVPALKGVSFAIEAGTLVSVVGPSGSGKSTLLHLMGGLDAPTSGSVVIDGSNLADLDDQALTIFRRRRLGFIFQFFNLLPTMKAWENVALPRLLDGEKLKDVQPRAVELLEKVGLGGRIDHKPSQLSGGEMQRVAVARALVADPVLVLADEPTGNLDSTSGQGRPGSASRHRHRRRQDGGDCDPRRKGGLPGRSAGFTTGRRTRPMNLFGLLNLRRFSEHRARTALSISGIAIGSALLVAVLGLLGSLTGSVEGFIQDLAGVADLEISAVSNEGLDERIFFDVEQTPGVEAAIPMVRSRALIEKEPVVFLGVDQRAEQLGTDLSAGDQETLERLAGEPGILIGRDLRTGPGPSGARRSTCSPRAAKSRSW